VSEGAKLKFPQIKSKMKFLEKLQFSARARISCAIRLAAATILKNGRCDHFAKWPFSSLRMTVQPNRLFSDFRNLQHLEKHGYTDFQNLCIRVSRDVADFFYFRIFEFSVTWFDQV
jgi:hypothetical protein